MFEDVLSDEVVSNETFGYFVGDGVLMRNGQIQKFQVWMTGVACFRLMVPGVYRSDILYLAHYLSVWPCGYQENFALCVRSFFGA